MPLSAGVDIGNSTTEIVITDGNTPVAWDRRPTRGRKGSMQSVTAAAALLRRIERETGVHADRVIVAPWHPVETEATTLQEEPPDTGRVQLIRCAHHSVVGNAAVSGAPWDISYSPPPVTSLIAIVDSTIGYLKAAERINKALAQGVCVSGVIVANDEAVLISTRISNNLPVVDGADTEFALRANVLFMEVRPAGSSLQTATDVWALHNKLKTQEQELNVLGLLARWVKDKRTVILGIFDHPPEKKSIPVTASVTWHSGESTNLFQAISLLSEKPVGAVKSLTITDYRPTSDVWAVDVSDILVDRGLRTAGHLHSIVIASLTDSANEIQKATDEAFGVPVSIAHSESQAAGLGARTTPGIAKNAVVLDIGGGTIDLIGDNGVSAAGAGELLTAAVAQVLKVPRGAADWIKRGPAQRLEAPKLLLSEDGLRNFVSDDMAIPATAVGALIAPGPSGFLPFGQDLQPAEWRIIRQSLKLEIISENVARILRTYSQTMADPGPYDIVIVGGPAADDELLPALGRQAMIAGLGRGNVAGKLGHRYAVAYGLTQIAE